MKFYFNKTVGCEIVFNGWKKVLGKIVLGFFLVSATILLAVAIAPTLSEALQLTKSQLKWARLGALGMVAWGVLGRSGWEVQSWSGNSQYEKFNAYWFIVLYLVGLFCGALGLMLEPAANI